MAAAETAEVLTFRLAGERYCLGIDEVAEIVDFGGVTEVPGSPSHVAGVTDLRGATTTVIDIAERLVPDEEVAAGARGAADDSVHGDAGETPGRIVVLDDEDADTATGWLVPTVEEVIDVTDADVQPAPSGSESLLKGLVKEEDGFTLWVDRDALEG